MAYETPRTLKNLKLAPDLEATARFLALAGDPTRLRILSLLFQSNEVCVGDISETLGMSISAISHHLQLLKDNGVLEAKRMGQKICYCLRDGKHVRLLRQIVAK